jgi:hypothetical protein
VDGDLEWREGGGGVACRRRGRGGVEREYEVPSEVFRKDARNTKEGHEHNQIYTPYQTSDFGEKSCNARNIRQSTTVRSASLPVSDKDSFLGNNTSLPVMKIC